MTLERMVTTPGRVVSITAAAASSHDDSIPKISIAVSLLHCFASRIVMRGRRSRLRRMMSLTLLSRRRCLLGRSGRGQIDLWRGEGRTVDGRRRRRRTAGIGVREARAQPPIPRARHQVAWRRVERLLVRRSRLGKLALLLQTHTLEAFDLAEPRRYRAHSDLRAAEKRECLRIVLFQHVGATEIEVSIGIGRIDRNRAAKIADRVVELEGFERLAPLLGETQRGVERGLVLGAGD